MAIARVRTLSVVAAVGCGWAVAGPAAAKEHTAACPELAAMVARVRTSLESASGQRLRGSSLGAYQVLLSTVSSMVRESDGQHCGALGRTLSSALRRANTSPTAMDASVELDLGIDAALSLATEGHLPFTVSPPKVPTVQRAAAQWIPVGEAAFYAEGCPDLFPLTLRLDGPPQDLPLRVKALLTDLDRRPRCARVRRVLQQAPAERLAHAVDSIRLDEPDETSSADDDDLTARCPELALVVERLASAIEIGAPEYNGGDAAACLATYQTAARAITTQIVGEARCPAVRSLLAIGLARAESAANANQAAWALRHSFDAILSGRLAPAP